MRDDPAEKNVVSNHIKLSVENHSGGKQSIIQTYHANWHGITAYMKGHTRVSCKGYLKRFKSSND
ncbi:hypothetical protein K501DRAFT_198025 [Backusella circina FSU 941]|nr:hypothetical protein K501DRAFT_198025 [Backusella circina FSU 941]